MDQQHHAESHSQFESQIERAAGLATARASEALSMLLYEEIKIKGPSIYYLTSPEMLLLRLRTPRQLVTINQTLYGGEPAKVSTVFGRDSANNLADLLVGRRGTATKTLGGVELDALREAANILSGSYLAVLGAPLGLEAAPSVPTLIEGPLEDLVKSLLPQPRSLCVEARFTAVTHNIELILLMAVAREAPARKIVHLH